MFYMKILPQSKINIKIFMALKLNRSNKNVLLDQPMKKRLKLGGSIQKEHI